MGIPSLRGRCGKFQGWGIMLSFGATITVLLVLASRRLSGNTSSPILDPLLFANGMISLSKKESPTLHWSRVRKPFSDCVDSEYLPEGLTAHPGRNKYYDDVKLYRSLPSVVLFGVMTPTPYAGEEFFESLLQLCPAVYIPHRRGADIMNLQRAFAHQKLGKDFSPERGLHWFLEEVECLQNGTAIRGFAGGHTLYTHFGFRFSMANIRGMESVLTRSLHPPLRILWLKWADVASKAAAWEVEEQRSRLCGAWHQRNNRQGCREDVKDGFTLSAHNLHSKLNTLRAHAKYEKEAIVQHLIKDSGYELYTVNDVFNNSREPHPNASGSFLNPAFRGILEVNFVDWIADPSAVLPSVFRFLGLDLVDMSGDEDGYCMEHAKGLANGFMEQERLKLANPWIAVKNVDSIRTELSSMGEIV